MDTPLIERTEKFRNAIIEEVKKQLWLAGPLIFVNLLIFSLQLISVMFVGRLGELPLSGASMATSFASVTGFSLLSGMASALDTLCGQSYGAKQYHRLGIHLQRAVIVLFLVSIPLAFIWANTRALLLFFGQDRGIATRAGQYARLLIPSLFSFGLLYSLTRFLRSQNIVFPMMVTTGISTVLHFGFCWVLVFKSSLGFRGPALAIGMSSWTNCILLTIYIKFSSTCSKTWTGLSMEAFRDIPEFLALSIPSACMTCLESWSFELMVLLAGLLPNPTLETSVLSISLNTVTAVVMIPLGLSGTISTRVSHELGAGYPHRAQLAISVAVILGLSEGILLGVILIMVRNTWGYAFSHDIEVISYVAVMLPFLAFSSFLDAVQATLSGIVRGCGQQNIGALINLTSYYIIGLPISVLLAFVLHLRGKGLWLGIICALITQVVSLSIFTYRRDLEKEAKKVKDKVQVSRNHVESIP